MCVCKGCRFLVEPSLGILYLQVHALMKSISKEKQLEPRYETRGKKHISSLKTATIKFPDDFINYFNDFSLFNST